MPLPNTETSYPIFEHRLSNGLRVVVNPDHGVPMVALNIWYNVGSRDEDAGQNGWAHLFEHLMFQGSANVASGEHLNLLQSVGGSTNATTSFDRTNYFETIPVGALDLALWLEADRLATLADHLSNENVLTQQEVVKEERRQRYDNVPYGDAIEHMLKLVFPPGHPYQHSVIGSMADVSAATPEAAGIFFRKHYRPPNAVISLVGDISPDEAFAKVEKYFGDIPGGEHTPRTRAVPLPALSGIPSCEIRSRVPADLIQLYWRLPARDSKDFDAATLAIGILTAGETSRLERRLVRELNAASGVGGGVLDLIAGTSIGMVSVLALKDISTDLLENELTQQINHLIDEGPTDSEIERAQTMYLVDWLASMGRLETRADEFSDYATLFGDPNLVNSRMSQVMSISADQVRDVAQRYFQPDYRGVLRYLRDDSNSDNEGDEELIHE